MLRVLGAIHRLGLDYVLIGDAAMDFNGVVRATDDPAVVIKATAENVERLKRILAWRSPSSRAIGNVERTLRRGVFRTASFASQASDRRREYAPSEVFSDPSAAASASGDAIVEPGGRGERDRDRHRDGRSASAAHARLGSSSSFIADTMNNRQPPRVPARVPRATETKTPRSLPSESRTGPPSNLPRRRASRAARGTRFRHPLHTPRDRFDRDRPARRNPARQPLPHPGTGLRGRPSREAEVPRYQETPSRSAAGQGPGRSGDRRQRRGHAGRHGRHGARKEGGGREGDAGRRRHARRESDGRDACARAGRVAYGVNTP